MEIRNVLNWLCLQKQYFVFVILVLILILSTNWVKLRGAVDYTLGDVKEWIVDVKNSQERLILLWTNFHSTKDFDFGLGQKPFEDHNCPVYNCFITRNRSLMNQSDAVIFHPRNINLSDLPDPNLRRSNQHWIFYWLESPNYTYLNLTAFGGFFNWTMTYRLDSDIINTYGRMRPRNMPQVYKPRGNSSRKLIAWMVSMCHTKSQRERYVEELRKYVQVDQFGECNGGWCNETCEKSVFEDYKFYLSFENSLCKDYVTEKFYKVFQHEMVPVVYGLGNYSVLVPHHSYIDARDFKSPKHLAEYLMALGANHSDYEEYFEWKTHYEILHTGPFPGFCELCRRLHERNSPKVYNDIYRWWFNGGENSDKPVCHDSLPV